jgi:glycosyltransferase involved in cell wall biosynthesis
MRNVLIVSPRFPPTSGPDYHRVRMLLPLLERHGWSAVVLSVRDDSIDGAQEEDLLRTIPSSVEVIECSAIPRRWSTVARIGSLSLRAGFFLRSAGDRLLRDRAFDLVFFSTTEFLILPLGLRWRRDFGVPFVVDLQDPWVNPYYRENGIAPPGGHVKHAIHQAAARYLERRVLQAAAHIITVSPQYPTTLMRRYPDLRDARFSVIPFGGAQRDFEIAQGMVQTAFARGDNQGHWVYAGAVVPGMFPAIIAFFDAFQMARDAGMLEQDSVQLHFIGTDYASGALARRRVMPIAEKCGVADCVHEQPQRIPYLQTLRCLLDADALLMFGSDEPGYTASKLFPYVLARKPLLTIFHEDSSVTAMVRELRAGVAISFSGRDTKKAIARRVFEQWFMRREFEKVPATMWEAFRPNTAESMTENVAKVFDGVVDPVGPQP